MLKILIFSPETVFFSAWKYHSLPKATSYNASCANVPSISWNNFTKSYLAEIM